MILELIAAAVGLRELVRKKNWRAKRKPTAARPLGPTPATVPPTCGGCPACRGHAAPPPLRIYAPPPAAKPEPKKDLFWDD